MGTLIIKYPNLKGFFTFFHICDFIRSSFLDSVVSTIPLYHGYNFKQDLKLPLLNYLLSPKNV